ncbi:MAB_1171c family putative transporter [Streptomyces sp. NPDC007905]|uniref:MAB_1171c family putative transporter n=1 Tax=Streptomyces sp. NPDC007905 TaxID=3364788 RepID=UPI0036E1BFDE
MSLVVYMAAFLFALAALLLRRPRTTPPTPLTVPTRVAVFLGALCFFCSAPATLAEVNDVTGIPNVGAPLTYSVISAYSCSLIILLIHWRGGPDAQIRRMVGMAAAVYGTLIVAIIVLFSLADAETERLSDLDTYYANTPYMREMIILYLMGHLASTIVLSAVCLKWARDEVTGLLRVGLWLILVGLLLDVLGFELTKVTAVVARWFGYNLDVLSTSVAPPAASFGALICSSGFVLPRLASATAAERQSLSNYRALQPLWFAVKSVATAPKAEPTWWHLWWQLPSSRLYRLEANIRDALLQLTAHFNYRVGETTYAAAVERGESEETARTVSEEAMIIDGIRRASGVGDGPADPPDKFRITIDLVDLASAVNRAGETSPEQVRTQ